MKTLQIGAMIKHGKEFVPPPVTVTAAEVASEAWTQDLTAIGTLAAVQGVMVSAELSGKVVRIAFESGATVRKGDLLIRQDTSAEEAQLPGAAAGAELARLNLERADRMMVEKIISQADHDSSAAAQEQAMAQANTISMFSASAVAQIRKISGCTFSQLTMSLAASLANPLLQCGLARK